MVTAVDYGMTVLVGAHEQIVAGAVVSINELEIATSWAAETGGDVGPARKYCDAENCYPSRFDTTSVQHTSTGRTAEMSNLHIVLTPTLARQEASMPNSSDIASNHSDPVRRATLSPQAQRAHSAITRGIATLVLLFCVAGASACKDPVPEEAFTTMEEALAACQRCSKAPAGGGDDPSVGCVHARSEELALEANAKLTTPLADCDAESRERFLALQRQVYDCMRANGEAAEIVRAARGGY